MKRNTYLTIACIILVLAGGLYYFVKDEPLVPPKQVQQSTDPGPTISFKGSTYVEEQDGKRLWELTAETIEVETNSKNIILKNLKGIFYQDNGGKIELVAKQAVMDNKTKDIRMDGEIKATSSTDGAAFTAPAVRWNAQERRMFGSGGITLTKEDTVITGDQFETDNNMEKIKVQGNALIRKGVKNP